MEEIINSGTMMNLQSISLQNQILAYCLTIDNIPSYGDIFISKLVIAIIDSRIGI